METLFLGIGLCVVVGIFANSRGRSGFGWFFLSCVITPLLGGLLVLALRNRKLDGFESRPTRRQEPRLD